jgi:hypothetical protein
MSTPPAREKTIADHACAKYSDRVGRSAAAKRLDDEAARMAVVAHVRHAETEYDRLLARGFERFDARDRVAGAVDEVLQKWQAKSLVVRLLQNVR